MQHSKSFALAGCCLPFRIAFVYWTASTRSYEVVGMDTSAAQSPNDFERMIGCMRERLRPTLARLFADWLRTYVGLSSDRTDENHLLKMLLQEVTRRGPH
jgi:hypothetical protein